MSIKNLARTVTDGGRARADRYLRRRSNTEERSAGRVTQATIMHSADTDCMLYPLRHGPKRANGFTRSFSPLPEPTPETACVDRGFFVVCRCETPKNPLFAGTAVSGCLTVTITATGLRCKRLLEEWLAEVARFRSLPEGIRRECGFCSLSLE